MITKVNLTRLTRNLTSSEIGFAVPSQAPSKMKKWMERRVFELLLKIHVPRADLRSEP
jgi:hypothetical protein